MLAINYQRKIPKSLASGTLAELGQGYCALIEVNGLAVLGNLLVSTAVGP